MLVKWRQRLIKNSMLKSSLGSVDNFSIYIFSSLFQSLRTYQNYFFLPIFNEDIQSTRGNMKHKEYNEKDLAGL